MRARRSANSQSTASRIRCPAGRRTQYRRAAARTSYQRPGRSASGLPWTSAMAGSEPIAYPRQTRRPAHVAKAGDRKRHRPVGLDPSFSDGAPRIAPAALRQRLGCRRPAIRRRPDADRAGVSPSAPKPHHSPARRPSVCGEEKLEIADLVGRARREMPGLRCSRMRAMRGRRPGLLPRPSGRAVRS